jgi:lipoyl(octanoyl) transferase
MVDWRSDSENVQYLDAVDRMESRVAAIHGGYVKDLVWFLEHPPLYTAGTSAKAEDLLNPRFSVYDSGRGGQYTYHGPGQLIAYAMLKLSNYQEKPDIRDYVHRLEEWIIRSIARFGVLGERRDGRVGIWVDLSLYGQPGLEAKIAALGVRVRHGIAYHGISINRDPDLSHFNGIVPCGISDAGVTSLAALGQHVSRDDLETALKSEFDAIFKPVG